MRPNNILIIIHFGTNIGYAIAPLERAFYKMALSLVGSDEYIHFAYKNLDGGFPETLPTGFKNIIKFNPADSSPENIQFIQNYIDENLIDIVFGFDLPVALPSYQYMRDAGVDFIISYFGAPISGINKGIKLLAKRIEVFLKRFRPDLFIFESEAMRQTAVFGRGISLKQTAVVKLGVDTNKYKPDSGSRYAYDTFNIPLDRKIVFYSGHMQKRKGVRVIINAAVELVKNRERNDVHFLLLGNKKGEEEQFFELFKYTPAERHITFGGYRNDIPEILPSCYVGTIASTGWDSFTMSSVEMAASGLPLIVSNLQGLVETVEDGNTGYLFSPGDHLALANNIEYLLEHPEIQKEFGIKARIRIENKFSIEKQVENLVSVIRNLT